MVSGPLRLYSPPLQLSPLLPYMCVLWGDQHNTLSQFSGVRIPLYTSTPDPTQHSITIQWGTYTSVYLYTRPHTTLYHNSVGYAYLCIPLHQTPHNTLSQFSGVRIPLYTSTPDPTQHSITIQWGTHTSVYLYTRPHTTLYHNSVGYAYLCIPLHQTPHNTLSQFSGVHIPLYTSTPALELHRGPS